ncbi:MAG: methyl-accepting chemotaxis protein [Planctomycetota bacterium]|nr:methyl-accepting chemotaxis protein [Planctomycetota bacterium]
MSARVIAATTALLLAVALVNIWAMVRVYRDDAMNAMVDRGATLAAVAASAQEHASDLINAGVIDMESLSADARAKMQSGQGYRDTAFFHAVPVVAGWEAAQRAVAGQDVEFRTPAFHARNPLNKPAPGSITERLLNQLTQAGAEGDTVWALDDTGSTLHYMRAIRLDESCMKCHGDPEKYDSPTAEGAVDGLDSLGFRMEGWQPGDIHGAYEVVIPTGRMKAATAAFVTWSGAITAGGVLSSIGLITWLMHRLVRRPLSRLERVMEGVAGGDLTCKSGIESDDEIGSIARWFDKTVRSLNRLVGELADTVQRVAEASTRIAASTDKMAEGVHRQEEHAIQVASAVDEMAASVTEVARKGSDAAQAATEAGKDAGEGGAIVGKTVERMRGIAQDVSESARAVQSLGAKGEDIGRIITVINDIADQTNLLALNAAIEAARAGEHGRGFAVVADEVRKLAERTTKATEEVARSIREIQSETSAAVTRMQQGTESVNSGVQLAGDAGRALDRIVRSSGTLRDLVESIAAATEEQSSASEEIARSISEIKRVTGDSAAGAQEAARAAANLSQQAERLQEMISRFTI